MKLNKNKKIFFVSMALLSSLGMSAADQFVSFQKGDLLINRDNKVEIYMDANDCKGVSYAANALVKDIIKVSGSNVAKPDLPAGLRKIIEVDGERFSIVMPRAAWSTM